MKKIIFLTMAFFASFAFAEDNTQEAKEIANVAGQSPMRVVAVLTNSPLDSFLRMPISSIYIAHLSTAYMGEQFRFLPLIDGLVKGEGDGDYSLECSLYYSKVGAKEKIALFENKPISGKVRANDSTIFFPEDIYLNFSPEDDFGDYNLEFEAYNLDTKERASVIKPVTLAEWKSPEVELTKSQIDSFLFNYNTHFNKEFMYASFLSNGLDFYKKGGMNGFNVMFMYCYMYAFYENEFLILKLYEDFSKMDFDSRKKVIMLNAFMNLKPLDKELLTSEELIFQNYMEGEFEFNLNPYEGVLISEYALEALWGEFFAKGNYQPIQRMLEVYKYKEEAVYAGNVFDKKVQLPSTEAEVEAFNKGRLVLIMNNYFKNYLQNPVLERYLMWTLENSDDENVKEAISSIFKSQKSADK